MAYALHRGNDRLVMGESTGNKHSATLFNGLIGYFSDVTLAAKSLGLRLNSEKGPSEFIARVEDIPLSGIKVPRDSGYQPLDSMTYECLLRILDDKKLVML